MEINHETSINELIEFLKRDHKIQYNMIPQDKPLKIHKKDNAFGSYLFVYQENELVLSIKTSSNLDSKFMCIKILEQALTNLGYVFLE